VLPSSSSEFAWGYPSEAKELTAIFSVEDKKIFIEKSLQFDDIMNRDL